MSTTARHNQSVQDSGRPFKNKTEARLLVDSPLRCEAYIRHIKTIKLSKANPFDDVLSDFYGPNTAFYVIKFG